MFNFTLYKRGIGQTWRLLLILMAVLTMYFAVIVSMFDPDLQSILDQLGEAMPDLLAIVGMDNTSGELVYFAESYLYGFIMLIFPMLFSIICAYKLIARHVDKGSMSYLLAAPVKRVTIAFTQMKVLGTGIFALILYATVFGIIDCQIAFPGQLDIAKFILLNVGALSLHLFIGGICFLCSCVFNDAKYALGFGAGIPVMGFVIQMMANAGKDLENAKYFTFYSLYNSDGLLSYDISAIWGMIALFAGAAVLFTAAIMIFSKKDMHI